MSFVLGKLSTVQTKLVNDHWIGLGVAASFFPMSWIDHGSTGTTCDPDASIGCLENTILKIGAGSRSQALRLVEPLDVDRNRGVAHFPSEGVKRHAADSVGCSGEPHSIDLICDDAEWWSLR